MANVSIKGLDKADVLCALVNAAKPNERQVGYCNISASRKTS